ncbi:DUF3592 domain-containing protein [Pseudoclavibacter terrae]|uniref:DUF3592 domain-containing protein n=1 Tax=Pseudoclavibacter terrae TaxID=1530195 RepID=UPI00232D9FCD|nr:DUF3592 domain-containing protein [Pseudoclavibacter terrae]
MSTVDPARTHAQRAAVKARRVGSPGALAVLLTLDAGLAVGGFLAAVGLSSLFAIEQIERGSGFPVLALMPLLMPVGIFVSLGFLIAQAAGRRTYTGASDFTRALADGQPIWFAGAAVGAWASLAALIAGTSVKPLVLFLNEDGTSVVDDSPWTLTVLPWAMPVALTVLLALSVWRRVARGRRDRRTEATFETMFASGTRTSGVVTQGVERPRESARVVSRWTIRFTDHRGQTRWTTPWGLFHEDSLPGIGDQVTVIYDPASPGDERRILIAREHPDRIESYRAHTPPFPFGA